MATKQSRRAISVPGPLYEQARDLAESQGRPLAQLCEEGIRLVMAHGVSPVAIAELVDAVADSAGREHWDAARCVVEMRRLARDLRGEPMTITVKPDQAADLADRLKSLRNIADIPEPIERSPRLAGVPKQRLGSSPLAGMTEIKRSGPIGVVDPMRGLDAPERAFAEKHGMVGQPADKIREALFSSTARTLTSVGWSPDQIAAETRRQAVADPAKHRRLVGTIGCPDQECPVCNDGASL